MKWLKYDKALRKLIKDSDDKRVSALSDTYFMANFVINGAVLIPYISLVYFLPIKGWINVLLTGCIALVLNLWVHELYAKYLLDKYHHPQ